MPFENWMGARQAFASYALSPKRGCNAFFKAGKVSLKKPDTVSHVSTLCHTKLCKISGAYFFQRRQKLQTTGHLLKIAI